ncbi:MAG: hypothetical protein ACK452_02620 [Bacteroidota bacterium]|jgi:hypothetical protein
MRVVDTIPHPQISIQIFHMNDKYLVKFEAGPMEQVFKFRTDQVSGLQEVKNKIDQKFIEEVIVRFHQMKNQLAASLSSSNSKSE